MSGIITQQRIHELGTYTQVSPGDVGYKDPSTIYLPVDKNGFTRPLKMALSDFLSSQHIETAAITATSVNVDVTYSKQFLDSSYFFMKPYVYKLVTLPSGGVIRQNVPHDNITPTLTGFTLRLIEFPPEPVVITYFASEPVIATSFTKDYIQITAADPTINIPGSSRIQVIGLSSIENSGLTLASNEITVSKTSKYLVFISFASSNGSGGSLLLDLMNETPISYGTTRRFDHLTNYSNTILQFEKSFSANEKIRLYIENIIGSAGSFDLLDLSITIQEI